MAASTANRRRTVASQPVPDKIAGTDLDVIEMSTSVDAEEPDLVEIFRLDGVPYCVDRNQSAGKALEYLHLTRTRGDTAAVAYLFTELLGTEAYDALRKFKGITAQQLGQVMVALQAVLLGDGGAGPKA